MVVVQVWDLSGRFPLGVQRVQAEVAQQAQALAQSQGRAKVSYQDLVQVQKAEWIQVQERESALPRGYRLDSQQGLVQDWESAQVTELELG